MASQGRSAVLVRVFWRRFSILALIILLAFIALGVWKVFAKERESSELRMQAESQHDELAVQAADLERRIAKLKTARGKEEALRQQYEVGLAGESMIVIVEPQAVVAEPASSTMRQWVRKFLPFW